MARITDLGTDSSRSMMSISYFRTKNIRSVCISYIINVYERGRGQENIFFFQTHVC